jgi:hypothetical protein
MKRLHGVRLTDRPLALRRVTEVLRENATQICEQWLQWVDGTPELAAVPLSRQERIDHVPDVLNELIQRVNLDSQNISEAAVTAAEKHGAVRCRQGYSIPQVLLEAHLLQRAITATVQSNLLGIDLSNLIPDLVEIGESLGFLLEVSVRAYQVACVQHSAQAV